MGSPPTNQHDVEREKIRVLGRIAVVLITTLGTLAAGGITRVVIEIVVSQ